MNQPRLTSLSTRALHLILGATLLLTGACDDDDPPPPRDANRADATDAASETGSPDTTPPKPDAGTPDVPTMADVNSEVGNEVGSDANVDGGSDGGVVLTPLQRRGQYLVTAVIGCSECHTPRLPTGAPDLSRFMAGDATPAPNCTFKAPNGDCLYPRNLTNHETGLKNRSDAEIKKMFLEGKRPAPTGEEALFPVMPYYTLHNMSDADADAIVAYLRTLPPVDQSIPRRGAFFDIPQPVPALDVAKIPAPVVGYADAAAAARGKYLTTQAGLCLECHTKHLQGGPTALDETKLLQGGEDFTGLLGPGLPPIVSKNITPDGTTGVGNWTVEEIVRALKMGTDKMGKGLCPPMPSGMSGYGNLTDQDATDIAHYLKSIPPVVNLVVDMCTWPPM